MVERHCCFLVSGWLLLVCLALGVESRLPISNWLKPSEYNLNVERLERGGRRTAEQGTGSSADQQDSCSAGRGQANISHTSALVVLTMIQHLEQCTGSVKLFSEL